MMVVVVLLLMAAVKGGDSGQQGETHEEAKNADAGRGQVRTVGQIFRRFFWMLKVKDCRHVCLFCEHYHICTIDGVTERS